MPCPDAHCHLTGITIVLHTCAEHGGFQAAIYEHVDGVHVDELPVTWSTRDGNLFGPHEFYDNVSDAVSEALVKLCEID